MKRKEETGGRRRRGKKAPRDLGLMNDGMTMMKETRR